MQLDFKYTSYFSLLLRLDIFVGTKIFELCIKPKLQITLGFQSVLANEFASPHDILKYQLLPSGEIAAKRKKAISFLEVFRNGRIESILFESLPLTFTSSKRPKQMTNAMEMTVSLLECLSSCILLSFHYLIVVISSCICSSCLVLLLSPENHP